MHIRKLLIFDLDDTIFETRSIGIQHLKEIFERFRERARVYYDNDLLKAMEDDLWKLPFDHVASKHHFPTQLSSYFSQLINKTHFRFKVHSFPDFKCITALDCKKILVTTGFKNLQMAKIQALGIESEFDAIIIDEIDRPNRCFKSGIFYKIISESHLNRKDHIVGDNPQSELKAGHELGLTTVQMAKFGQSRSSYANHYFTDFEQLLSLLNDEEKRSFSGP